MRFSQLFLRMGQDTSVEVFRRKDSAGSSVKGEFVDSFRKYDKVPKEIWSGFVCRIWPIDQDAIAAVVEDYKDECQN